MNKAENGGFVKNKSIKSIIKDYLDKHNYDGLYNERVECFCHKDDDLFLCEDAPVDCKPGYSHNCSSCRTRCSAHCSAHIDKCIKGENDEY